MVRISSFTDSFMSFFSSSVSYGDWDLRQSKNDCFCFCLGFIGLGFIAVGYASLSFLSFVFDFLAVLSLDLLSFRSYVNLGDKVVFPTPYKDFSFVFS
jgi:hypothetical protein